MPSQTDSELSAGLGDDAMDWGVPNKKPLHPETVGGAGADQVCLFSDLCADNGIPLASATVLVADCWFTDGKIARA
jgi:hypothetical protein